MIKICFIINNLKPGGAERQFVELIKGLDKSRFSVVLYLYAENQPAFYCEKLASEPGIKVIRARLHAPLKALKVLKAVFRIRKFLKKNDFDLVQTTLMANGIIVRLAGLGLCNYQNRIVTSIRNNFDYYPFYEKYPEKFLLRNSFAVCNTRYSARKLSQFCNGLHDKKIFHIYNGYDVQRFFPAQRTDGSKQIIIGTAGRMQHEKNQIQILKAFKLCNFPKNISIYIIGDFGAATPLLREYAGGHFAEGQVRLLPNQKNIEDFYNKFHIFVLPSLYEGCPNVLFEAMLSKCLCVISQNANTDNFITHNVNGLVYDNTDKGLADILKPAIGSIADNRAEKMIESGHRYARSNFSLEQMTRSYARLYEDILQNQKHERKK
jgi:glycosyltransferase EpsF